MCGITGAVWDVPELAIESEVLDRMTDVLRHRGPDGRGVYRAAAEDGSGVALGHRRLSIIDLAGGRQPLSNEDGSVWITFNGEIYNYRELRADLEAAGHRFRTHSDTETIVHLYEQHGTACLDFLRGMFAFAIWDAPQRRLFLARDRMGQKPLVYRLEQGRLSFGSEIKSLLQVPGVPREVDPVALDAYLALLYVPHPRTMFRGISKLPPAHIALYERGRLSIKCYWRPDFQFESPSSRGELQDRLRGELNEAVRLRLRSDVPVGAFLSGGIDSTVIVGLMQCHLEHPARTFTIGFAEGRYDETSYARLAAEHLGSEHCEMQVQPGSIELLPALAWHFDEPFGDSSTIPTFQLSQLTRQHVKVALTGDGGDELFAGYPRYRTVQQMGGFDGLPFLLRAAVANRLWDFLPAGNRQDSLLRKLRFRMQILRQSRQERYANWVTTFPRGQRRALYAPGLIERLNGAEPSDAFIVSTMQAGHGRGAGRQAMFADLQSYLPCDLLAKVDITSMAHGLECRSPLMDHRVVELATSMAYRDVVRGGAIKPMLTDTFADLIPPRLRARPKMGFCVPLDEWFRSSLREFAREFLLGGQSVSGEYFLPERMEGLLQEHASGAWNHGDRIWALLCLEAWHRTWIDPSDVPAEPLRGVMVG